MVYKKFFSRGITAWANDYHACPVEDAKWHLRPLGVRFIDRSLSGSWRLFYKIDPAWRLRVINRDNVVGPYEFGKFDRLARLFAAEYGPWINRNVDFFYCSFVPHLCHLFLYFRKPILLHASFRFEGNHPIPGNEIEKLSGMLRDLRREGRLTVAATNRYDAAYLRHFCGGEPVELPATALYAKGVRYAPRRAEILIGPSRFSGGGEQAVEEMKQWFSAHARRFLLRTIRELYPRRHAWADLARHPAIVVIPYSVHAFAITEYLAMGIPLFFPSRSFLVQLHLRRYILQERKADLEPAASSLVSPDPAAPAAPDPNNDFDAAALDHWLSFCDWYGWPVVYFDSWEDLAVKLETTDLRAYHRTLVEFGAQQERGVAKTWEEVLLKMGVLRQHKGGTDGTG